MARPTLTRTPGTIARIVRDRGFGFIRADDGGEFFFHQSAVGDFPVLREGDAVTFVKGAGPKGPRAEAVQLADRG